jgi:hypothetical protein
MSASSFRARAVDHLAVAIGTSKGLFIVSDGVVDGPFMAGDAVLAFAQLPSRMLAAASDVVFGPSVRVSEDGGLNWDEPGQHPVAFPAEIGSQVVSIRQLHLDRRAGSEATVWAGTEPAALFRSADAGNSFQLVAGLWNHADRPSWEPGCGRLVLNSIVTHPERPSRIAVAISAGGVYVSEDNGTTFEARNNGIEARFLPEPHPEHGQCVHKLTVDSASPDVFWVQNHWGIYRSPDAGASWESVGRPGSEDGVPSDFGYAVAAHPDEPDTAYVLPLESDAFCCTVDGKCRVYRTTDGGQKWEECSDGLPMTTAYLTVLSDGLTVGELPPYPLVFGARSGHVFASVDGGDSWRLVAAYLPPISCVRVLE